MVGDEGGAVGGDLGDGRRAFAVGVGLHEVGELVEAEVVCFADLDGREGRVEEVIHEAGCEGGKGRGIRGEGLGIGARRKVPAGDFVGVFRGSPVEARGGLDAGWCAGFEFGWRVHALLPSRLVGVRDGAQRGLASGCGCVSRSGVGDD